MVITTLTAQSRCGFDKKFLAELLNRIKPDNQDYPSPRHPIITCSVTQQQCCTHLMTVQVNAPDDVSLLQNVTGRGPRHQFPNTQLQLVVTHLVQQCSHKILNIIAF